MYRVFVDPTKAFDTVNRETLWKTLGKLGCPPTFIHMLKQLHRDMKAYITVSGTFSDKISVDNGVKQGDILLPLFSIYFASCVINDCDTSVYLRFRTSGKVYNLRRFDAKTNNFETLIRELLYTDDAVFVAHMHSIEDMQLIIFTCTAFGLTISLKRRKRCSHLHQENNIVSQT